MNDAVGTHGSPRANGGRPRTRASILCMILCAAAFPAGANMVITMNTGRAHWTGLIPHTSAACAAPCADYAAWMVPWVSITLPPLPPNTTQYVEPVSVLADDGLHPLSAAVPGTTLVTTDAEGWPVSFRSRIELWQSGSSPHRLHDRVADLIVRSAGTMLHARSNQDCRSISADRCASGGIDAASSQAYVATVKFDVVDTARPVFGKPLSMLTPFVPIALAAIGVVAAAMVWRRSHA